MADILKLKPIILQWEGGYVCDPKDRGGDTNKGVTIATFRAFFGKTKSVQDLKDITDEQWLKILRVGFWNPWKADQIKNQSIANILVDFAWASGATNSIKRIQHALALNPDGQVGPKTLSVLNGTNGREVFDKIKACRLRYVESICEHNTTQVRFLRGWENRINYFKYVEI